MFHKKKFVLVDEKQDKNMYSAKCAKWVKYVVTMALIIFALLLILANVKSKSYYRNLKSIPEENPQMRSISTKDTTINREVGCTIRSCSVTCSGDVSDVKTFLNSQKTCPSISLQINDGVFPNNRLPNDWLKGSFNLSSIKISGSTLNEIDDHAFNHNTVSYVTEIELNKVQLQSLTANTFVGLNHMDTFTLINKIEIFSGQEFLSPMSKTIKVVIIKHITDIPTDPGPWLYGKDYAKLMKIVFDGSNFGGYIKAATFDHLQQLSIVSLVSCKITYIADGTFDFMMSQLVVYISLSNNKLTHIAGNYISKVASLKVIDISYNPWDCTCKLEDLITEYKQKAKFFGNANCATPLDLAGRNISEVNLDYCKDETTLPPSETKSTSTSTQQTPTNSFTTEIQPSSTPTSTDLITQTSLTTPTSSNSASAVSEWSTVDLTLSTIQTSVSEQSITTTQSISIASTLSSTTSTDTVFSSPIDSSSTQPTTYTSERTSMQNPSSTASIFDNTSPTTPDLTSLYTYEATITSQETTPSPQNRTTTVSAYMISIECQRYSADFFKILTKESFYIDVSPPDNHFNIFPLSETSIQIKMQNPSDDLALMWFYDQPSADDSGESVHVSADFKAGCQSELEDSLIIEGLAPHKAYTFCLVKVGVDVISPFNCLSYCTQAHWDGLYEQNNVWLKSEDKALTLGLFSLGMVLALCIGMGGMFVFLRSYPALLKGSKRVILINRSKGDVLVMPRVGNQSSLNGSSFQNSFEKKAPNALQRRFSDTSTQSGLSYIMANNYEPIEYHWRMNIVNDMIYSNRVPKSPPPPLPKRISQSTTISNDTAVKIKHPIADRTSYDYGYIS